MSAPLEIGFFSSRQVEDLTSLNRVTIWRLRRAGAFPQPVPIGGARVGYPRRAVLDWIDDRMGLHRTNREGGE